MSQIPRKIDRQLTYLDPFLLDRARVDMGLSQTGILKKTHIALNTLTVAFKGEGVHPLTADRLCACLGCKVTELLAPWDPRYKPPAQPPGPWSGAPEWEPSRPVQRGRLAPNGLYYIVFAMTHRHTPSKRGRGKFYHLSWMREELRKEMHHKLSRHAEVCARVGLHPQIVVNFCSTPVTNDEGWWVIDDWVGEKTVADHLLDGPFPRERLPRLLLEIGQGLDALHNAEIVFRELAPSRVLISDKDGRAVLTDFELAKLLDGTPSVSDEWPEDPFRAPEVDGGETTVQADLYSLANVAAASLAGPSFNPGLSTDVLRSADMPKRLQKLLLDCLETAAAKRPPGLSPLIKELARWAEK